MAMGMRSPKGKKSMAQMMGMKMAGHSNMSKPMAKMEKREYSGKGLPAKMMAKHEKAEYGGRKCPKCGKVNCSC